MCRPTCCFCSPGSGSEVWTSRSMLGPWNYSGIDINPEGFVRARSASRPACSFLHGARERVGTPARFFHSFNFNFSLSPFFFLFLIITVTVSPFGVGLARCCNVSRRIAWLIDCWSHHSSNRHGLSGRTIKAQENFVITLEHADGHADYIYTGDRWCSAPDKLKSHDFQYVDVAAQCTLRSDVYQHPLFRALQLNVYSCALSFFKNDVVRIEKVLGTVDL